MRKKPKIDELSAPWALPAELMQRPWNVDVIGAGGTGSQVLFGLGRMDHTMRALGHPGLHVEVWDGDRVSEANVGRQLFSVPDIGRFKSDVIVTRVNHYYGTRWKSRPYFLNRQAMFGGSFGQGYHRVGHIFITCTDTVKSRQEIFRALDLVRCYWMDFGNGRFDGQVVFGEVGVRNNYDRKLRVPHLFDLHPELMQEGYPEDNTPSCSVAEALRHQDLFVNQGVATLGLDLLWRWYRQGKLKYNGWYMNLDDGQSLGIPIKRVPIK